MKAHFSLKRQLRPILTHGTPRIQDRRLYTQCNGSIIETDMDTFEVIRDIPFERVSCFDVQEGMLVVCNESIKVYDLARGEVKDTVCTSKAEVCAMYIDVIEGIGSQSERIMVVVGRIDGSVSKVDVGNKKVVWSYRMANIIFMLGKAGDVIYSLDCNEMWISNDGKIQRKCEEPEIIGVAYNKGILYSVTRQGILTKWENVPKRVDLGIECDRMAGDEKHVYVCKGMSMYVYDYDGKFKIKRDILTGEDDGEARCSKLRGEEMSLDDDSGMHMTPSSSMNVNGFYEESEDCYEDESGSEEGNKTRHEVKKIKTTYDMRDSVEGESDDEDGMAIERIGKGVIVSSEQEIFFVDDEMKTIASVIGNNDEITDLKQWNDVLFVATNSGRLRYAVVDERSGEYAFCAEIVVAHQDAIISLSVYGDFLMSVSKDKTAILWHIEPEFNSKKTNKTVNLRRMKTLRNSLSELNGCCLGSNIFVIVGSDQILQIWDYKENVYVGKIHDKEINGVAMNEQRRLIATCSQDKTAKILDFEGRVLHVLLGHTKGIWSVSFGQGLIATCSADSTIRLWEMDTFSCVGTLSGHKSGVLKGVFCINGEKLITSCATGEIKVWDIKKKVCEMNIGVHRDKVWAMMSTTRLISGGNGAIAFFEDDSLKVANEELEKKNLKESQSIEIEKCIQNNMNIRAVEILLSTDNYSQLFKVLIRCYRAKESEVFDVIDGKHKKLFEAILKQGTFKNSATIHWLIEEGLRRKWSISKELINKMYLLTEKHSLLIDEIYSHLLGFTALR
ncbi:WD40 domain-containing protein [Ordospora colligata]|nr:WD40 domain-containing protein [Ordospora colligata]